MEMSEKSQSSLSENREWCTSESRLSSENDAILKECQRMERNIDIIKKYENGPTKEDMDASQYSCPNVNRYGFIISNVNHGKHFDERISNEKTSIKRWSVILENWDKYGPSSKRVRSLIVEGLPDTYRGQIWKNILEISKQIAENPNLYENLKSVAMKKSQEIDQIDKDVERTHRTHVAFNVRYSVKQKELFNILVAYSVYDCKVRYCQGMNEIAGTFLLYMNEEEAFFALKTLLTDEVHNMHGFYSENFPKLIVFEDHLEKTIKTLLPELDRHFNDIDFSIKIVSTRWFLLCFINSIPFSIMLRVWDRFILEGSAVMYPVAYTIIKYHANTLIKLQMDQIALTLNQSDFLKYDVGAFFQLLEKSIRKLTSCKLYPIPGVVHDIIDFDISQLGFNDACSISESRRSSELEDDISTKSPPNANPVSSSTPKLDGIHSANSNNRFAKSASVKGAPLFNPFSNTPPNPPFTWEQFSTFVTSNSKEMLDLLSYTPEDLSDNSKLSNLLIHLRSKLLDASPK